MTNEFLRQVAQYARAHNIPKPDTKSGMDNLIALFNAEQMVTQQRQEMIGARPHLINDGSTVQIADPIKEGPFEDDWNRLLRDRAKASIGPNNEVLDDFDTEFQMMGQQQSNIERNAPFSSINPRSVFTGSLGGQQTVFVNGQSKMVARWQGEDAETLPVTVAFGPSFLQNAPDVAIPQGIRAYGRVIFGTHGQVIPVEVDITTGCQFTVGASSVVLEVGLDSPFTTNNALILSIMSGLISFHPSVRTAQVTCTKLFDLNVGDTGVQPVPAFAKELVVWRSDNTVALTVTLRSTGGADQTIAVAGGSQMTVVPLAGAVSRFQITNAANAGLISAIFNLGI